MDDTLDDLWYLYIIRTKDATLYTGITKDVKRRFSEHCEQGSKCAKYLRGKTPLTLEFWDGIGTHPEAMHWEAKVKKLTRSQKEHIIKSQKLH